MRLFNATASLCLISCVVTSIDASHRRPSCTEPSPARGAKIDAQIEAEEQAELETKKKA